jgi:hypothetical protein
VKVLRSLQVSAVLIHFKTSLIMSLTILMYIHASFHHFHEITFCADKKERIMAVGDLAVSQTKIPGMPQPPTNMPKDIPPVASTSAGTSLPSGTGAASTSGKPALMMRPPSPTRADLFRENKEGRNATQSEQTADVAPVSSPPDEPLDVGDSSDAGDAGNQEKQHPPLPALDAPAEPPKQGEEGA